METPLSFEATLPWPPTVNTYWRHRVIGKLATVYISQEGQAYRKAVNLCLAEHGVKTYELEGDLRVEIEVFPPDKVPAGQSDARASLEGRQPNLGPEDLQEQTNRRNREGEGV
jgi:Holliday junction resolvase RusA-like endonuclease